MKIGKLIWRGINCIKRPAKKKKPNSILIKLFISLGAGARRICEKRLKT